MELNTGRVVISAAGHDKGGLFAVVKAEERCVYIADGKERKISRPKRKNIRHIRATLEVISPEEMTDKKLRRKLNELRKNVRQSGESESLV